jgi:hypothetical protein
VVLPAENVNCGWVGKQVRPFRGTNVVSMSHTGIEVTFVGAAAVRTRLLNASR